MDNFLNNLNSMALPTLSAGRLVRVTEITLAGALAVAVTFAQVGQPKEGVGDRSVANCAQEDLGKERQLPAKNGKYRQVLKADPHARPRLIATPNR